MLYPALHTILACALKLLFGSWQNAHCTSVRLWICNLHFLINLAALGSFPVIYKYSYT